MYICRPSLIMEAPQFKDFAKEMVEYIAGYLENIRDRYVLILFLFNRVYSTL